MDEGSKCASRISITHMSSRIPSGGRVSGELGSGERITAGVKRGTKDLARWQRGVRNKRNPLIPLHNIWIDIATTAEQTDI